jgi:phage N-6-adenine-methyltransferase
MSRGLGRLQRGILAHLEARPFGRSDEGWYEFPTWYLAAVAYGHIDPADARYSKWDARLVTAAQLVSTRRALAGLHRAGLVERNGRKHQMALWRAVSTAGGDPLPPDRDAWYTPTVYVEAVRAVLGHIELDPFSDAAANEQVRAERFYTRDDDAFTCDWTAATVWMNPPYGPRVVAQAVDRLVAEIRADRVGAAICLVNNTTDTRWFQRAFAAADAVCFLNRRIIFWNADGKPISNNPRGQVFMLFGSDLIPAFRARFAEHGTIVTT